MKSYMQMSREELLSLKASLEEEFKTEEAKGLSLNMARGKPGASQLALSMPMLDVINSKSDMKTLLGNELVGLMRKNYDQLIRTKRYRKVRKLYGATLKRMRPAPQGRGYRIRKRSNHVTLFVGSKSNNEDQN